MESFTSWTDDIPICKWSGIGSASNEIYRRDGRRAEMHPAHNRYFHFNQADYSLSIYGVFDGFGGPDVADFVMKRLPAELLLGQLSQNSSDETVKESLRQAFLNVDREYFDNIMTAITHRIVMKQNEVPKNDPTLVKLEAMASIGSSAAVSVLLNNKLFVAACGDTRAVLCLKIPSGEIKTVKLSVDHVLGNEDEDLRLQQLGIKLSDAESCLGKNGYTRCLGFHRVKGGFKEEQALQGAQDEPVIADPEIHGAIGIEPSFQFLIIFSRALTDCLSEVASYEGDSSLELCRMILEQFGENTTATGVAQSVVDQIIRRHREQFEMDEPEECLSSSNGLAYRTREDITLLLRNFNAKLKKKKSSISSQIERQSSNTIHAESSSTATVTTCTTKASTATESSEGYLHKTIRELPVDEDGCIKPYVDFSYFNEQWAKYQESLRLDDSPSEEPANR